MIQILPIDFSWLYRLQERNWLSKGLPTYFTDWDSLFASMIREYFFVSIFRSISESLASENASRLESMQAAEKNVEERLSELQKEFQQTRQTAIMDELLDVIAGYEILKRN
jgi:F-type H+-transporting ATPase subunit gamma